MSEKAGTPTSMGIIGRTPTPNNGNGVIQGNAMIALAAANGVSSSQLTPVTPTSNVTVTTTAAMTQPHPPITPQVMAHPGVPPSPIPQMQVIQQPIHAPAYLQHIYNPHQQQLLMSAGNITLQPTAMSPSIQAFSAPVLGLPLLSKAPTLEPKTSSIAATFKPMIYPSTTVHNGVSVSTSNGRTCVGPAPLLAPSPVFTANRQITPQMLAAAGKPILQGQSNYMPSSTNQTLVIGQLGVLSSQPSLIPTQQHSKAVSDAQKVKPFVMGQATALQPKSPILPHPQTGSAVSGAAGTATATVLNSSQFKQISQGTATIVSSPQLITSQAAMIASQAQLLNPLQAIGSIHGGITWTTPGGIQSPALFSTAQNPIFIRGQHQDMFLQSPPAQAQPAIQPSPGIQITKPKQRMDQIQPLLQVRPATSVATQTTVTTSLVQTSQLPGLRAQVKHRSKAQVNRMSPGVVLHQKADAANQTKLPGPTGHQSIASQTKINNSGDGKQPVLKASVETQANVPIMPKPAPPVLVNKSVEQEEPMEIEETARIEKANESTPTRHLEAALTQPPLLPKPIAPKLEKALVCGVPTTTIASITTTTTLTTSTSTVATIAPIEPGKDKQPQKAIVKPHVLTHVIEGYVIQEGPEPFPVNRTTLIAECAPNKQHQSEKEIEETEEPSSPKADFVPTSTQPVLQTPPDPWKDGGKPTIIIKGLGKKRDKLESELAKCEFCGKMDEKKKFKRSKRFCSTSCAKRYNVGCSKRIGLFSSSTEMESSKSSKKHHGMKSRKGWRKSSSRTNIINPGDDWQNGGESSPKEETTDSHSGAESSLSPTTPTSQKDMEVDNTETEPPVQLPTERTLPKSPVKWTVPDVYEFIKALPGCTDYADEFRIQEIDGQALLLLKEDHLMTAMNMKLGPALKICARINSLKEEVNRQ